MTIRAAHYDEAVNRLVDDPVVRAMAADLIAAEVRMELLAHDDGTPRFEFMNGANAEYRARGGTDGAHIGAIGEAILKILNTLGAK